MRISDLLQAAVILGEFLTMRICLACTRCKGKQLRIINEYNRQIARRINQTEGRS